MSMSLAVAHFGSGRAANNSPTNTNSLKAPRTVAITSNTPLLLAQLTPSPCYLLASPQPLGLRFVPERGHLGTAFLPSSSLTLIK